MNDKDLIKEAERIKVIDVLHEVLEELKEIEPANWTDEVMNKYESN